MKKKVHSKVDTQTHEKGNNKNAPTSSKGRQNTS